MSTLELNGRVFDASTTGTLTLTGEGSATTNVTQGLAKAWAFYNGTGTVAVSDSLNVSGITDNGTGDYTLTFSNNMGNATFGGGSSNSSNEANGANHQMHIFATGSLRFRAENSGGTLTDSSRLVFNVQGDLA